MKKSIILAVAVVYSGMLSAQNKTDISLKWKDSIRQETSISSKTGNLYKMLTHHGPAVENEWVGFRFYFDHKVSIDVYNKARPGLELAAAAWYPTPEQQKEGWGSDQYKVWSTVGCGGIRLWDGEKEVFLNPVKNRTARVCKEANHSYMEMLSEGVPYKGDTIDVLIRTTVFSGIREAKVEAFALCDKPVQFYTGINFHPATAEKPGTKTKQGSTKQPGFDYILTWGVHPEDVAAFPMNIGAAVLYHPADFSLVDQVGDVYRLVSKPTKYLSTWITSACEKEQELNTMDKFNAYLECFQK